jgi:Sulfotransferase domain
MPLPDFLIIGAMKCGTSTLQAQLAAQPGVFMTTPKEPNFFSDDAVWARGLGWYESLFAGAAPGELKGEASTHYTKLPTYPDCLDRLASVLPAPKLIYMIRDPVDRMVSHYIHDWTLGHMPGDVAAALRAYPELVAYSRYAMQIAPYAERFGTDRILLVSLERLEDEPQAEIERIGAFLGLPARLLWREEVARMNASAERIRRFPLQELLVGNPVAAALRRVLVPRGVRAAIKRRLQMRERPRLPETLARRLEDEFAEDYARLRALFPGQDNVAASYSFVPA